ncbi:MAG: sigma-54-dependent transcriptional regulator [Terriglobia bacterium]
MPNPPVLPISLVAIDEDPASFRLVREALDQEGLDIRVSTDAAEGLDLVFRKRPHIVLLQWSLPKSSGLELLARIAAASPETAIILMASDYSPESALEAIQQGATDFLPKPVPPDKLRERIRQIVSEVRARHRSRELEREQVELSFFQGMIGRSPKMLEVFDRVRRIAPHFRTVLVTGETGTGKELVAKALHNLSPVAAGPFVACNCSAIVETLLESELFGHVRGAFTGARQDKIGLLEYAHGGTLLLDEIGDMPLATQSKLLRVLQNQEIQRVGSPIPRKIDIRVVAATHRDLRAMVANREFRQDLYYRLSMVEIRLPPLAQRKEDLPVLARHFLDCFSGEYKKPVRDLTPRALARLAACPWPGNVRELENVLGHACMMATGEQVDITDLPHHLSEPDSVPAPAREEILPLEEFERLYVRRVLRSLDGNKVRAAEALKISRSKLYTLLEGNEPKKDLR